MALFIIVPLYLRDVCGLGAGDTTLLLFVRPLAIGITAPVTGELLQLDRFRGRERLMLLCGSIVSISDKVLGVLVVWWGGRDAFLLEPMLLIQGAATGVMSVAVRLMVMESVDEVDRGNCQGVINMVSSISSSAGMALGVALVADSSSTGHVMAAEHTQPQELPYTSSAAAIERFRQGMLIVLLVYLVFLWIPPYIYIRHARRAVEWSPSKYIVNA
jgi:hypothetical protein